MKRSLKLSLNILMIFCLGRVGAPAIDKAYAEDKIRIGISSTSPGFLPTVVAEQKGLFSKYGLSSEHIRISLSVAMNAAGTGELEYAMKVAQRLPAAVRRVPVTVRTMPPGKVAHL